MDDELLAAATSSSPTVGQVYAGRFTQTATAATDALIVRVPSVDEGRTGVPVKWTPLPGPIYPTAGDAAWVMEALSENGVGNEWVVVAWVPAAVLPTLVTATDPRLTNARTPTGPAGGALAGTYPNPGLAQPVTRGVASATWPGSSTISSDATVSHGLGATPAGILLTAQGVSGTGGLTWWINTKSSTVFTFQASTASFQPPLGTTQSFAWEAF